MRIAVISDENGRVSVEFRRIPFDARELIRIYQESGRPFAEYAIAHITDRSTNQKSPAKRGALLRLKD